jgi:uncharacterized protein YhbP (UPF0306 family)
MAEYNIQYEKKAKYIINTNKYMVISTSDRAGEPWGAALFYACDEGYNFYFYSNINSRHCINLLKNPKVSLAIFNQNSLIGSYEGVQLEGKASMVSESELPDVINRYFRKIYPDSPASVSNVRLPEFETPSNLRFFKVEISNIYLSEINGRIEVVFNKYTEKWM